MVHKPFIEHQYLFEVVFSRCYDFLQAVLLPQTLQVRIIKFFIEEGIIRPDHWLVINTQAGDIRPILQPEFTTHLKIYEFSRYFFQNRTTEGLVRSQLIVPIRVLYRWQLGS